MAIVLGLLKNLSSILHDHMNEKTNNEASATTHEKHANSLSLHERNLMSRAVVSMFASYPSFFCLVIPTS